MLIGEAQCKGEGPLNRWRTSHSCVKRERGLEETGKLPIKTKRFPHNLTQEETLLLVSVDPEKAFAGICFPVGPGRSGRFGNIPLSQLRPTFTGERKSRRKPVRTGTWTNLRKINKKWD